MTDDWRCRYVKLTDLVGNRMFGSVSKKIVADFTEAEQDAMFSGTAASVYRL